MSGLFSTQSNGENSLANGQKGRNGRINEANGDRAEKGGMSFSKKSSHRPSPPSSSSSHQKCLRSKYFSNGSHRLTRCGTRPRIVFADPWALEWPFYISWLSVIVLSHLQILYILFALNEDCQMTKSFDAWTSLSISSINIVESFLLFSILLMPCSYKLCYELTIYYCICSSHITLAFVNLICCTFFFFRKTCYETLVITSQQLQESKNGLDEAILKYDLRLTGVTHIMISVLFVACVVSLAGYKERTIYQFIRLNSKRSVRSV